MVAASKPSILASPYKAGAVGALALTALTTLLTWTSRDGVDTWGLAHDDGFLVVLASVVGVAVVAYGVKAAWIVPGFIAALLIRDVNRVRASEFDVGVGLWAGLALALLAAVLLLGDLVLGIREARGTGQDQG